MASALFRLSSNGGSSYLAPGVALADSNALSYAATGTYAIRAELDSALGVASVAWSITSADDANVGSLPALTVNPDRTVDFTVPRTGGAWLLRCVVNGGVNPATGAADPSLACSLKVCVRAESEQQVIAVGEAVEAGTYGWTKAINDALRAMATRNYVRDELATVNTALGFLYGGGLDGARTISSTPAALTGPVQYSSLTIDAGFVLPAAGHRIFATGTVTLAAGAVISCDGSSASGQTGGTAYAAGQLATAGTNGPNGAAAGINSGLSGGTTTHGLGGNGGQGGAASSGGGSTGTAGTCVLPTGIGHIEVLDLTYRLASTFTAPRGGAPGGSGGAHTGAVGGGAGGPGGLLLLRCARLVLAAGARIRARGGNGGNGGSGSGNGGGGGGGGGGGMLVIVCDEIELTDPYSDHFDVSGGAGGTGGPGASNGAAGSAGRVRVYVGGRLVYSLN
jgi:hypothetical protein